MSEAEYNFNSRPSARGDIRRSTKSKLRNFNSRPSARGDALALVNSLISILFQFTPLREGRRVRDVHLILPIHISIHAPPRGATTWGRGPSDSTSFQFTPLREGRLLTQAAHRGGYCHFNSRPSARGDTNAAPVTHAEPVFQFTPLREGRRVHGQKGRTRRTISIHAPPRGATWYISTGRASTEFQFTPLREGRHFVTRHSIPKARFQFTPLREGRPRWLYTQPSFSRYFNSRPSARGDGKRYAISANLLFNPYKSAWLNNSATQFVEIILVIFHRIIV